MTQTQDSLDQGRKHKFETPKSNTDTLTGSVTDRQPNKFHSFGDATRNYDDQQLGNKQVTKRPSSMVGSALKADMMFGWRPQTSPIVQQKPIICFGVKFASISKPHMMYIPSDVKRQFSPTFTPKLIFQGFRPENSV